MLLMQRNDLGKLQVGACAPASLSITRTQLCTGAATMPLGSSSDSSMSVPYMRKVDDESAYCNKEICRLWQIFDFPHVHDSAALLTQLKLATLPADVISKLMITNTTGTSAHRNFAEAPGCVALMTGLLVLCNMQLFALMIVCSNTASIIIGAKMFRCSDEDYLDMFGS